VRTGTVLYFVATEHKSRCPVCCGAAECPEPSRGGSAGETRSGYGGPTPEEAQEYRRRQLARKQEEERQARAAAARARYVGPTAQERARYGYSDSRPSSGAPQHASSPAGSGPRSAQSGVERVVHGMSNVHSALYGGKVSSPARASTLHPLAAMASVGMSTAWDRQPRAPAAAFTFV
jgi:hypothetical protein